ncbi:MAG: 2-hydroxyacyl-CoA dehydratase [Deltaproteobacteria bacterium]|nr:2-hydroxyacyl-CoA dehydratase [Deltaproteobacteria bacterium]
MEERLRELISGNRETSRTRWAMEWKDKGGKVIGLLSQEVPEEVISAAGMLPFRITGTWDGNISHARVYRSEGSCGYCNHVLESLLTGDLDFLDGIIIADIDQDLVRLWDVLSALKIKPLCHIMHVPFVDSGLNHRFFTEEIRDLIKVVEDFGGKKITDDSLLSSIETYNKMRDLLTMMYDLRKKDIPPLSGAEALGITTTAGVMPKEEFNRELEALLPYLGERETDLGNFSPRLLVSSEMLDEPAYMDLIEENCIVAMDDMDTGSRYFNTQVNTSLSDPAYALARRYLGRAGAPRMAHWDRQVEQIIENVKDYSIDGVLGLPLTWCHPQSYRICFLRQRLQDAGIPYMSVDRAYNFANAGQIRTRIGAFIEMLA